MQGGEQSLEEILASIRQVMVREGAGSAGAGDPANRPPHEAMDPADEDEASDILELGEAHMLLADESVAGEPEWTEAGPSFLATEPSAAEPGPALEQNLGSTDAASAVRQSLAALERLSETGLAPQPITTSEPSLDTLARTMLRPMIAEWLEANLPDMVERQVQAEIARIVGRQS